MYLIADAAHVPACTCILCMHVDVVTARTARSTLRDLYTPGTAIANSNETTGVRTIGNSGLHKYSIVLFVWGVVNMGIRICTCSLYINTFHVHVHCIYKCVSIIHVNKHGLLYTCTLRHLRSLSKDIQIKSPGQKTFKATCTFVPQKGTTFSILGQRNTNRATKTAQLAKFKSSVQASASTRVTGEIHMDIR